MYMHWSCRIVVSSYTFAPPPSIPATMPASAIVQDLVDASPPVVLALGTLVAGYLEGGNRGGGGGGGGGGGEARKDKRGVGNEN